MATTENTFNGDGSNLGPFTFTFSWLESTDIKVSVGNVTKTAGTHYNLQALNYATRSGGQVLFTAGNAPPVGTDNIRIYRETDDVSLSSSFVSGSAIRAQDLNENFLQSLYVAQETRRDAFAASEDVQQGVEDAALALANSQTAITTANAASATATSANATATSASSAAASATSTANTALSTADSAVTTANNAVATANSAVTTANTASSNATTAVNTANDADTTANQALNLVSSIVDYTLVANVAAIPGSPANDEGVELIDSTGIQSFSPLTGVPSGFVGSSALRVKIKYTTVGSTWQWISYTAADPETRYVKVSGSAMTGQLLAEPSTNAATPGLAFSGDANTGIGHPGSDELSLITAGTARLTFDSSGNATFTNPVTTPAGSTITGYLTSATAASTYQPISGMSSYLTTATAASTYQTQAAMSNYLTTANAASTYLTQANATSTYLTQASAASTYQPVGSYAPAFTHTDTSSSTDIAGNEWISVLTSGLQITLPVAPTDGMQVRISVGNFTDTVILRNGNRIMNDTTDLTIDLPNVTVTLVYDDSALIPAPAYGWRIV